MHHRRAVVLSLVAVAVAVAPAARAQSPEVAFDAVPAPGSGTDASGGWFSLSLPAGGRAEQAVTVQNTSSGPLVLAVGAATATTMAFGGASYAAPEERAQGTAAWIELEAPDVRLAPGERRRIPFAVRVPADAAAGDHLAGISLAAPSRTGDATTLSNGSTTSIDLRTRRVIAVHVAVPGPAEPRVAVRGVEAALRPPGPQLEIGLANVGRRLTRGRGVLTLLDDDVRVPFDLGTFVPGTSIAYPLPWPDGLAAGSHRVRVDLEHDGQAVEWEGDVTVTGEAAHAARDAAPPASATAAPAPPAGTSPVVLAAAVLAGVAVAGAGQAALRAARRRRA